MPLYIVTPAQAGIQTYMTPLGSRLRGNDEVLFSDPPLNSKPNCRLGDRPRGTALLK